MKQSPYFDINYGWPRGADGWDIGMDENLLVLSFLSTNQVLDVVDSVPDNPAEGDAYVLTSDNSARFFADASWHITYPADGWEFKTLNTNLTWVFENGSPVQRTNPDNLAGQVEGLENRADDVDAQLSTVNDQLNLLTDIPGRVTELESNSVTQEQLNQVESSVTDVEQAVEGLDDTMSSIDTTVTVMQNNLTNLQESVEGKMDGVVAGEGVSVDNTDPLNPVISATGAETLRQDLEDPDMGAAMVGFKDATGTDKTLGDIAGSSGALSLGMRRSRSAEAPAIVMSIQDELDGGMFNVQRMGAKPGASFDSTDAFLKAQEECAFLGGKALRVPGGAEPYNIESSILNPSQGDTGIGLHGEGIGITRLRWAGGAGRLIDAFNGWQYGFSMSGFTLESLATGRDNIIPGSVGLHIERSQTPGLISQILVKGFDLNIDVGVHAQFLHWLMIASREGNTLLNSYGQNADMNVWDNCMFYSGRYKGVLLSSPRTILRDCWFGPTNAFSEPDYVDVTIGYQAIRPEDIGKSSSTQPGAQGHTGQHGALVRPRFERGNSGIHTGPYIRFEDIDTRPSGATISPFLLDNPVMPNSGPSRAIEVKDKRRGLRILAPEANDSIGVLVHDTPQADGSIQYIEVTENYFPRLFSGQRDYMKKGKGYFLAGDGAEMDASGAVVAGSDTTNTHYPDTGALRSVKGSGTQTTLFYFTRPTSTIDARFYIKAARGSIGTVTISCYTPGSNYLFRMRDIPVDVLVDGVSIVLPGTSGGPVTLSLGVPPGAPGEIVFERLAYAA